MNDLTDNNTEELSQMSEDSGSWRKLREAKGISLETIVQQTNISLKKLEALENQDFAALGTETFVLGYIRRYAKILDVDAQMFIDTYKSSKKDEVKTDVSPSYTRTHPALSTDRGVKKKKIPLFAITLGIVLVWVLIMSLMPDDAPAPEKQNSSLSSRVSESGDSRVEEQSAGESTAGFSSQNDENIGSGEFSASDESATESEKTLNPPVASQQVNELSNTPTPETQQLEAQQVDMATNDEQNSVPVTTSNEGEDVIVMRFTDDCWVQIKDANGEVIFAQLQTKEDNLQIFGQAPFSVMLGNARAVEVIFNGEQVASAPPGTQNTMRLTLSN